MKYISLLLFILFIAVSCEKEIEIIEVNTGSIQEITNDTAILFIDVSSNGNPEISEIGVCWNASSTPTIEDEKIIEGHALNNYTSTITGLEPETDYYVRAYVIINSKTIYGNEEHFTTSEGYAIPTVTTDVISNVTENSAFTGGEVIADDGLIISARGVCWNVLGSPNITDNPVVAGDGTGVYTVNLIDLTPGTTYYIKAYASDGINTFYGEERSFTTCNVLTEDVILVSQEEINDFSLHCNTVITETLTIEESMPGDIVDLTPLAALTTIQGGLIVRNNTMLSTLEGLNNIDILSGGLVIDNNASLTNLNGMNGLISIGGLSVSNNENLTSLNGLNELMSIVGSLSINNNTSLTNLDGMNTLISIGGGLSVSNNENLTSLNGLNELMSIVGSLNINNNTSLINLDGMNTLISIGGLSVYHNDSIINLIGLNGLTVLSGGLFISNNSSLFSLEGLDNLEGIGGALSIGSNYNLQNIDALTTLTSVGNGITISHNNNLNNLNALNNLTSIGWELIIEENNLLIDLDWLGFVYDSGVYRFYIVYNAALSNLCGLQAFIPPDFSGEYLVFDNAYNPTIEDMIAGNCAQ